MTTAIFSQKNVCAALGFAMAITIVIKAKAETSLAQQTARFETTKPTPQIGFEIEHDPKLHIEGGYNACEDSMWQLKNKLLTHETTSGPEAIQVNIYKQKEAVSKGLKVSA